MDTHFCVVFFSAQLSHHSCLYHVSQDDIMLQNQHQVQATKPTVKFKKTITRVQLLALLSHMDAFHSCVQHLKRILINFPLASFSCSATQKKLKICVPGKPIACILLLFTNCQETWLSIPVTEPYSFIKQTCLCMFAPLHKILERDIIANCSNQVTEFLLLTGSHWF